MNQHVTMLKKKIILYTDTPLVGGAEKHMQLLAKYLRMDGYDAQIICSNYKNLDHWCEELKEAHIPFQRIPVAHKHDPRAIFKLRKILKSVNPDILHLHLWNPASCRYALMLHFKKTIITEHDPFALSGLKQIFKKNSLKKIAKIITVSNENQRKMSSLFPEFKNKIITIHNGIELEEFEKKITIFSTQEKNQIRTHLFEALEDETVIISVATLHPRKGLKYLIQAFEKVVIEKNNTKLIIIGDGPEKITIQKLINELKLDHKIKLLGHQNEIEKLMKSADLFVLPSIKEAFGLVILEAMAAQLPVVASNTGGIPEIIEDGKNGILVEPANPQKLAEAILLLIKNQPLKEKIAFLGSRRVKDFDIKTMVKKTEMIYDNLN